MSTSNLIVFLHLETWSCWGSLFSVHKKVCFAQIFPVTSQKNSDFAQILRLGRAIALLVPPCLYGYGCIKVF